MSRWDHKKIAQVEHLLAAGLPDGEVEDRLADAWQDLGAGGLPRNRRDHVLEQVRRYIKVVRARWKADAALTVDERRAQLTQMAMDVYREARRKGHTGAAQSAIESIARINGVTTQTVATVFDARGVMTSAEAIAARLRELRAKQLEAADVVDAEPEDGDDVH